MVHNVYRNLCFWQEKLDSLLLPAWDLINIKKFEMKLDHLYNPPNLPIKYKAAIFSSRACPLACNFCDMFLVMGKTHRKRSATAIVDEIELLNKSYGVNYFSFMDDQLTLNKAHIIDVCDKIIERKLKIIFDTPNGLWINSLREEVVAKMVEAGLVYAKIAIEHGNDHMRNKVIGKVLDRKKIFEVAGLLKKYKVMSTGLFIMGFLEDTNETLKDTYDMMDELQLDKVTVSSLVAYPGTALFKQVVKDKLFIHGVDLSELWQYPLGRVPSKFNIKPYNLSIDDLHKWRKRFDLMKVKHWKTNAKAESLGRGLRLEGADDDVKETFKRKRSSLIYESVEN